MSRMSRNKGKRAKRESESKRALEEVKGFEAAAKLGGWEITVKGYRALKEAAEEGNSDISGELLSVLRAIDYLSKKAADEQAKKDAAEREEWVAELESQLKTLDDVYVGEELADESDEQE